VRQSTAAVQWLAEQGYGLAASTGMQTWELLLALGSTHKIPLKLYVPAESTDDVTRLCERTTEGFALNPSLTEYVPVVSSDSRKERDRLIIEQADLLVPISLREGGRIDTLLAEAAERGQDVCRKFETPWQKRQESLKLDTEHLGNNPELSLLRDQYITHWTRATNSAWPDERPIDFYNAVIQSSTWARSGFETLRRITGTRTLIGSSRNMPDRIVTVAFSSLSPMQVIPLMTWRARHCQMSFEPYGIGIDRKIAEDLGIEPVKYFRAGLKSATPEGERWLWQSIGKITDWRAENEHRHKGNLDLSGVSPDSIVLFCHTSQEASILREQFPFRVILFN